LRFNSWRLLSWNVAGRVVHLPEQAAAAVQGRPDLVALQEVLAHVVPPWRAGLSAAGQLCVVDSFALAAGRWHRGGNYDIIHVRGRHTAS
jgi:hypothetical protein